MKPPNCEANWQKRIIGPPKDTGGATKASAEYHLPDYTEPEPKRRPRLPKEEGEAARNNRSYMSAARG